MRGGGRPGSHGEKPPAREGRVQPRRPPTARLPLARRSFFGSAGPPLALRTVRTGAPSFSFDAPPASAPPSDLIIVKQTDLTPLSKAWDSFGKLLQPLFAEHAFLTIICAFFAVLMTLSCYRFLRSISPGLVAFILMLMLGILTLHWTFTRTEPALLKPAIDLIAPFFPLAPNYSGDPTKPAAAQPVPPRPARP